MGYFTPQILGGTRRGEMIDAIRLHIPPGEAQGLTTRLNDFRRRDIHTGTGTIGTMRVYQNLDGVTIHGSLAKYLREENITPLSRAGVQEAIGKLERETGLNLSAAVLGSVEIGTSIVLKEKPAEYLRLFGDPAVYAKCVYSKSAFLESVSFGTSTGAFQFSVYDKGREMADKRQTIPRLFSGKNVLRLEYRIIRRRGIQAKFRRDLTAYDLYNYEVYRKLQGYFLEAYQAIPKTGRRVYIDTSKPMTPARLEQLQAEQYRQLFPLEYKAGLQALKETGALTEKNLERIRARDRRQGRDFAISDKSPLIAELDNYVSTAAMSGA
jgi:hypothetical protein